MGVQLTKSERTRLSRDIRKKFQVAEKLSKFSHEFKLKKGSEIKWIVEDAKEAIMESKYFSSISKIILFGSTVENQRTLKSDVDIAVVFYKISLKEATRFRVELSSKVNEKADIQVYNFLPLKIKKEIDKKGKILYER